MKNGQNNFCISSNKSRVLYYSKVYNNLLKKKIIVYNKLCPQKKLINAEEQRYQEYQIVELT